MTRSSFGSVVARLSLAAALCVGLTAPAWPGSADDDLQAVKRAVLASSAGSGANVPQARPPAEDATPPRVEGHARERSADGPSWFRVRVVEKGGKRGRVSVNLPLGFVRTLGAEWPVPSHHGCRARTRCGATLGALLRALDSGPSLVEIEDDEASVRVWID